MAKNPIKTINAFMFSLLENGFGHHIDFPFERQSGKCASACVTLRGMAESLAERVRDS
jgi:hypothetical protein